MLASEYLNKCHFGDVRAVLKDMIRDGVKVQTIVCSPPYWGLRRYTTGAQVKLRFRPDVSPEVQARVMAELESLGVKPE